VEHQSAVELRFAVPIPVVVRVDDNDNRAQWDPRQYPVVGADGKLYVVGGYRESSFQPTSSLRIYDIRSDTWNDGPPLPTARGALAVAVLDGASMLLAALTSTTRTPARTRSSVRRTTPGREPLTYPRHATILLLLQLVMRSLS